MQKNHTPLNDTVHRHLKIKTGDNFAHLSQEQLIPVVVQEFVDVATEFPIIFVKDANSGQFLAVAMMGIQPEENLYCSEPMWQANYIPLAMRNYPLSLMSNPESGKLLVCIDQTSKLVNDSEGQALFDENGQQTEFLQQRAEALSTFIDQSQTTRGFIDLLLELNLLVSRNLSIQLDSHDSFNANGIYIIDQQALDGLPQESHQRLRDTGALQAIYAQLLSMNQIHRLTRKKLASH